MSGNQQQAYTVGGNLATRMPSLQQLKDHQQLLRLQPCSSSITLFVLLATIALALPAFAYDYPLSSETIRDAYFLGKGSGGAGADFLAEYAHTLPKLKIGAYTSVVRLETPYTQIAEHARETLNYDSQDAVKDFLDKPAVFRVFLDICFRYPDPNVGTSEADKIRIKMSQDDKEIVPKSVERSQYYPFQDSGAFIPSIGEHVQMDFDAGKIESSPLTIEIDTPNGRHAETTFDLSTLK
jgi:hypothetical protein